MFTGESVYIDRYKESFSETPIKNTHPKRQVLKQQLYQLLNDKIK
ncbi:hypothetical protein HMPREF0322_03792 [Desulfitobacterium hafniense DP7]|uniref:Uncharacterized protein n=1 Tax=Desulfitobacterium hafniense DP7 TaxID=537010 RepID=G9XS44_DESHA|nr:hypothetical protein HMPREF0322_03792 [Desulfitobacterium hafniense DP7]